MSASGPGSGSFGIIDNGWGTGGYHFQGFPVQNSSETSTLKFEVPLPTEYVAGADLQLVVRGRYDTSGGSSVSATIDANVFKLDADGVAAAAPQLEVEIRRRVELVVARGTARRPRLGTARETRRDLESPAPQESALRARLTAAHGA